MITVDCSDALAIKDKLLVYVADKLEALPILKNEKFMLDALDDSQTIDKMNVISAIVEFLKSADLKDHFQIIPIDDNIKIEPLEGKGMKEKLEKISKPHSNPFFECTHCGFMTMYEEELKTHRLIHYI